MDKYIVIVKLQVSAVGTMAADGIVNDMIRNVTGEQNEDRHGSLISEITGGVVDAVVPLKK